jgi:drug/metabolite transporter (DMT)-like permease
MWGFVIWQELPTLMTWAGALLTLSSGVYILYRDQKERSENAAQSTEKAINISNQENAET